MAIYTQSTVTANTKLVYCLRDHLGSLQYVVNEAGTTVLEEYSYDAWGCRRDPVTWKPAAITANTARGFTGHEHIDLFELVNMDGRVYDPRLGRFMSPDPYVQAPFNSQSYNRYSYCLNNPLSFTDPSGYSWFSRACSWVGKNWKPIVTAVAAIGAGVATALTIGAASPLLVATLSGAAAGFTGGVVGTALNGGSVGQCLGAGIVGGLIGAAAGLAGGAAGLGASLALNSATGISGGVVGGAFSGAVGGAVGGFVGGFGSALANRASPSQALNTGWNMAAIGAVTGGILGGSIGGYKAYRAGNNIWTNQARIPVLVKSDGSYIARDVKNAYAKAEPSYGKTRDFLKITNATSPGDELNITIPEKVTVTDIEVNNNGFCGDNCLSISVDNRTPVLFCDAPKATWTTIPAGGAETISISNYGTPCINNGYSGTTYNMVRINGYIEYPSLHFF
ncbi:MAG TPA: RHS repeat-associated core domain-containing protein [Bacteroidales bacterium]|nr:RHS repeat-associated core domain-containing protein [Bacteroidales bacterium]